MTNAFDKSYAKALKATAGTKGSKDTPIKDLALTVKIGSEPDTGHETDELLLYLDNDSGIHNQSYMPVVRNMARKLRSNKYEHSKAVKGWEHVANFAAQKYKRDFGVDSPSSYAFSPSVRRSTAAYLAWRFIKRAQDGEYDHI